MTRPLGGFRVVSIAVNLPGPLAAARLADLGARVVKVEPPSGDPLQQVAADWYEELARGQEVVAADLKADAGKERLQALLGDADLLLTASRPSGLARLGLGWQELSARWPQLSQVAILGHASPDGDRAGHDLTYQATAGLLANEAMPPVPVADFAGAERAVTEGLAALLERTSSGVGSYREVALADVGDHLAAPLRYGLTTPTGVLGGGSPSYGLYRTKDGYIALAALEPHFWQRLLNLMGISGTRAELEAVFRTATSADWEDLAAVHDLPLSAVRSCEPAHR